MGLLHNGALFSAQVQIESKAEQYEHKISVKRSLIQNVRTISLGVEFSSRLDNEASFWSLLKVKIWRANCASVPPPTLVISSQRWHIHSAPGQQREWTCSGWMSARWQPQKLCTDSEFGLFVRILRKQDRCLIQWDKRVSFKYFQ